MKKSISLKNAALLLGTSTRTIYRLIGEGEVIAFKLRGSLRIIEESLTEYQQRQILKVDAGSGIFCDRL